MRSTPNASPRGEALGYSGPHFPLANHYAQEGEEWMYGRGSHDKLTESGDWREKIVLTEHRYMLEDVAHRSVVPRFGRRGWPASQTPLASAFWPWGRPSAARISGDGPLAGEPRPGRPERPRSERLAAAEGLP